MGTIRAQVTCKGGPAKSPLNEENIHPNLGTVAASYGGRNRTVTETSVKGFVPVSWLSLIIVGLLISCNRLGQKGRISPGVPDLPTLAWFSARQ